MINQSVSCTKLIAWYKVPPAGYWHENNNNNIDNSGKHYLQQMFVIHSGQKSA